MSTIKRIGCTNGSVTHGKAYYLDDTTKLIKDDHGRSKEPDLHSNDFWMRMSEPTDCTTSEGVRYATRLEISTERLTQGKEYLLSEADRIKDDNGHWMKPCLHMNKYWKVETVTFKENQAVTPPISIFDEPATSNKPTHAKWVGLNCAEFTNGSVYAIAGHGEVYTDQEHWYLPKLEMTEFWQIVEEPTTSTKPKQPTPKEKTMLKIETKIFIEGSEVTENDVDEVLHYIGNEEGMIQRLDNVKVESPAIKKLKKKHQDNIKRLVKILDGFVK